MGEYNFDAAKLISKIWITLSVLFLFIVIMFFVDDEHTSQIIANFSKFGRTVSL
jgi:hypothetical protein